MQKKLLKITLSILIFALAGPAFGQINRSTASDTPLSFNKTFENGTSATLNIPLNISLDSEPEIIKVNPSSTPLTRYNSILISSSTYRLKITMQGKEIVKLPESIKINFKLPETYFISSSTGLYYFDNVSPKWLKLTDAEINTSTKDISIQTDRLYDFAIFEAPGSPDILKVKENTSTALRLLDYGDRNLLQSDEGKVYLIAQGKKKYISTLDELDRYSGIPIYPAKQEELNLYQDADLITLRDRQYASNVLLRNSDNGKIYLIANGMKKHLSNMEQVKHYSRFKIISVNNDTISSYPLLK